ncbi:hypothetical protein [Sulfitobacter delicatus]|uniref:Excalibur calcium-binding domain-containing protein n=1 Tax=Sulfitobacter delicatus TaxID=218672 RepID=A0A1G7LZM7_9RHOB|nr:hypothetical protein [Sulfitobacter delicatus]SDF54965.1 hypothetical protein SAMN04489759_102429 [Sulfitobacter delicatus]
MITRTLLAITAGGLLAACQPAIPDSGRGVGFGDSNFEAEQRARDAALAGNNIDSAIAATTPATTPVPDDGSPEATAAETARVLAATRPGGAPVQASPSNPAPAVVNAVGISNENNFDAVSDQRSIEADAARVAANRAQYQVVQPEALPERTDSGPNIVAYALQTKQSVGQKLYSRIGFNKARKYERACSQYGHADQAQIAFLAAGGPEKDRNGMDPDGDGFACDWDPTPFRRAAQG